MTQILQKKANIRNISIFSNQEKNLSNIWYLFVVHVLTQVPKKLSQ